MRKTVITIVVALAGFATVAQTTPKGNAWYTGAKLGWSQYHDTGFINGNGPIRENQLSAGTFGGYQVNPYIDFEMGYDWLGRMSCKGSIENGAYKAQGVQLTAKLDYPVTDDLDVYTCLDGMVWRIGTKSNVYDKSHDTSASPVFAGGVEHAITLEIATCLEYQWANNIDDTHTIGIRLDSGMLSLGISYRLGQGEVAPVVTPAPAPAPEVQTKRFTLKSDVLFTFNKATLRPEGQAALNRLYSQLSNLGPKDDPVVVLDYTDYIGSDTYNRALSERRAQSVVDYLISKGVPANKISARGMDESNSVTGNICDNMKQRAALVDCLTPDHRVEVEVKGIEDVVTQLQA